MAVSISNDSSSDLVHLLSASNHSNYLDTDDSQQNLIDNKFSRLISENFKSCSLFILMSSALIKRLMP